MISEIKTATITGKGQISIPKSLRNIQGFKAGDTVAIISYRDRIELIPLMCVNERMKTMYASEKSLSKDWNAKEEDKAWKNL